MKITLRFDGRKLVAKQPHDHADHVTVSEACACGSHSVRGLGVHTRTHDEYIADAVCCKCEARRGQLVVSVSTIFGIEEDERVTNGRCRVY